MLTEDADRRRREAIQQQERDDRGRVQPSASANLAEAAPATARETRKIAASGTGYSGSTLEAAGQRDGGRWARGSVDISNPVNSEGTWRQILHRAGIVLDYCPGLAPQVAAGQITLNDAFTKADTIRTSAERDKIMARPSESDDSDGRAPAWCAWTGSRTATSAPRPTGALPGLPGLPRRSASRNR